MKFAHTREVQVPAEYLFHRASDFTAFEQRAKSYAVDVHRQAGGPVASGQRWQIAGIFRGKPREVSVELAEFQPHDRMAIRAESSGYAAFATVNFIALTRRTSRVDVVIEARATSFRTRLLLQTARLARGRIAKRIKSAVNSALRRAEHDYLSDIR